jgi:hypothetical protein
MASGLAERRAPSEGPYSSSFDPKPVVKFWEIATGKEIFNLKGHEGSERGIAWSPDGRLVASRGLAGIPMDWDTPATVRVWDPFTGKELARFGNLNGHVTSLVFSPDGTSVAAGQSDGTILILDVVKAIPKLPPAPKLEKDALEVRWRAVGDGDAGKACQAMETMAMAPTQFVPFLRSRLKPVGVTEAAKIQKWIADLDSENFAVRQAAAKQLEETGEQVLMPIQKALNGNTTLEARRRLEQILKNLFEAPGPETVRTIRAIMVLERIGSPEAQGVLEALSRGAPGARETDEAKASMERLAQRTSKVP